MIIISDGTIIIDTKLDNNGVEKGVGDIRKQAAKLANEYKKAGMSSSEAWKKAWSEIGRESSNGTKKVKADMESIASLARKCAGILAGAFVIDKIKDFTSSVYKTGIEYNALSEQAQVAWSTILGSHEAASKMMAEITDYAAKTPFSKMGVDTMAKQLTNAGFEGQAVFDQLTKIGDMGSAFGIQEDSLREMVRQYAQVQQAQVAYTEDLNILQDRGIPIYKALGEVMGVPVSQVKKLASQGKVTADVYNKAIDSMANKTKGAMEAQSQTFNGMMSTLEDNLSILWGYLTKDWFNNMKNSLSSFLPKLEDFVTLVGTDGFTGAINQMLPQLSPLVNLFSDIGSLLSTVVIPALLGFGGWVAEHIQPIAFLATVIGSVALGFKAYSIISGVIALVQGLAAVFGLLEAETLGEAAAQWAVNLAFLACPITWIVIGIGLLVGAFIYLWTTSEGFRNFWIGMWEAVKGACIAAWNGISHFFTETIPNAFKKVINFFKEDWKEILLFIVNPFVGAFALAYKHCEGFRNFIDNLVNSIKDFFVNGFEYIKNSIIQWGVDALATFKNWGDNVWNFFTQTIPNWIQSIANWFSELPHHIGFALGFVVTKLIMWGVDMFNYITTNVPIWIDNITNWFAQLPGRIWTWLVDSLNKVKAWGLEMGAKATQIASEFLVNTGTWLSQLPGRIWTYLTDSFNKVKQWGFDMGVKAGQIAAEFLNNTIDYFSKLPGRIWTWLSDTVSKVRTWGGDLWNAGVNSAKQLVDSVVDTVEAIPGKMLDIGRHIVEGLWQGIINAKNWFMRQVNGFFSGIVDGAKAALGIHSPSRVMRDQVGKWIMPGVSVGIDETMPDLKDNMKSKMLGLTKEMKAKVKMETSSLGASIVAKSNAEITSKTLDKNNSSNPQEGNSFTVQNILDGNIIGEATYRIVDNKLALASRRRR